MLWVNLSMRFEDVGGSGKKGNHIIITSCTCNLFVVVGKKKKSRFYLFIPQAVTEIKSSGTFEVFAAHFGFGF